LCAMAGRDARHFALAYTRMADQKADASRDGDVMIFERAAIEKQCVILTRLATDKQVGLRQISAAQALRYAAQLRDFEAREFASGRFEQSQDGCDFERGAGAEAWAIREILFNQEIGAAGGVIALTKQGDDIPQRLAPVTGCGVGKVDGFVAARGFEVSRKPFGMGGMGNYPGAETNGCGKHETLIAGSVFSHEMHATGRAEDARFGGIEPTITLSERQPLK